MMALLKKDLYIIWKCTPLLPVCILVIGFVSALNSRSLALLLEMGILISGLMEVVLEIDEGNRWHVFQDTMPMSRARVVTEKYVFLVGISLIAALCQSAMNAIVMLVRTQHVEVGNVAFVPSIVFCAGMVWSSLLLPFFFRFGAVRGRQMYFVMLTVGLIGALIISRLIRIPNHIPVHPAVLVSILLGTGVLFGVVSCAISTVLYRRRDIR